MSLRDTTKLIIISFNDLIQTRLKFIYQWPPLNTRFLLPFLSFCSLTHPLPFPHQFAFLTEIRNRAYLVFLVVTNKQCRRLVVALHLVAVVPCVIILAVTTTTRICDRHNKHTHTSQTHFD